MLPTLLVSVDGVGPLLVLKTASGSAGAVTEALDQAGWSEVMGTIAGDDTVLVITRSPEAAGGHRVPDPGAGQEIGSPAPGAGLASRYFPCRASSRRYDFDAADGAALADCRAGSWFVHSLILAPEK